MLLAFSVQTNVLPLELSKSLLLVVALSMLLTPALFILYDWVSKRAKETVPAHPGQPADEIDETAPIIIAGVGRFGQTINRMISMNGLKTTVLDHNIDTILAQRKFGMKGFYGDPTRPELMQAAGLMKAEILVVAVDDQDAAVKLTKHARRVRPDIHIIARAYDRAHVYRLYQAGASQIVRETFDSSIRAGKYALMKSGIPAYDVETAASDFYDLDRQLLKEMSSLWDPNVPITENKAFMERARELNSQFITALDKRDIAASEEPPEAAAERPAIEHST